MSSLRLLPAVERLLDLRVSDEETRLRRLRAALAAARSVHVRASIAAEIERRETILIDLRGDLQ